jgi:hypothetical protein
MFRISVWVCAFLLLACFVLPMAAQQPAAASTNLAVPPMVNFSGVLTDVNGKALTGAVGVTFYLYQESQGGAPLWMETQNVQADKAGHYTAALGSTSSHGLPASVFASGEARWLGVQIQGQAEQPRVLLMSVPYALKALDAETIGGKPASSFMLAPAASGNSSNSGKAANLPPGTITGNGVAGFIPVFTGPTTIADSKIFQTVGLNVGVGTATPAAKLDVAGTDDIRDTLTLFPKLAHPTLTVHGTAFAVSNTGKVTFIASQTFPGTVTNVIAGAGLSGGGTGTPTLSVANGGVTNAMLAHSSLTVTANSPLSGGGAVSLGGSTSLGLKNCAANQILEFTGGAWTCVNPATGTVTSVATGLGLKGGTITTTGTLTIDPAVVPQLAGANSFTNLNAISVSSGSPALAIANGSGDAIDMSTGNIGVNVTSGAQGIHAVTSGDAGVFEGGFDGSYNLGPSGGVYSESDTDGNFNIATYGFEFGSTQKTIGVWGFSASPIGAGVLGQVVTGSILGSGFVPITGLWGDTGQAGDEGVLGTADDGFPLVGQNNSPSGDPTLDLFAFDNTNSGGLLFNAESFGFGGICTITVGGHLACNGALGEVAPVDGGARKVALNAISAPENWFEDAGSGQLSNGEAVINLERLFGETVNTGVDYHVFLTPNGDCKGLYVAQKSAASFVVRELGGGTSSIAFDYRIMAKRKGYEQIRLADRTKEFNAQRPNQMAKVKIPRATPQQLRDQHRKMAETRAVARLSSSPLNQKR